MEKFKIDNYHGHDKAISITGPLWLEVDYDDVHQPSVDVLIQHMLSILNEHWTDLYGYRCPDPETEDDQGYCEFAYSGDTVVDTGQEPPTCPECGTTMERRPIDAS